VQIGELVLRYLGVLLTWPVVSLILGVLALRWFREPLSDFFRRMVKGEGYGVRVEAADPSQQRKEIEETKADLPPKPQDDLQLYIQENPQQFLEQYLRLYNGYWFEKAYNLIYGSQVSLLERLAERRDEGEKYINLVEFYNEFLRRSNSHATQMADYLGFLKDMNFIEYFQTDGEHKARITPFGLNFLSYIKTQYPLAYRHRVF